MHFDWKILLLHVVLSLVDVNDCATVVYSHIDNCTDAEVKQAACLNDGECFVVILEQREPACRCPIPYTGKRCHELNIDFIWLGSTEISIIVCALVLVLLLSIVAVYIWYRRRKKLPIVPCKKDKHTNSIKKNGEGAVEGETMLGDNEKNNIEMTTDH